MAVMEEFIDDFLPLYADQTRDVIRARWDAWANENLSAQDVDSWTDTREGSFFFIVTEPGVREGARIYDLMGSEVPAAASPLWAWESYLDDHAAVLGVERSPATYAEGYVTFTGPVGTVVLPGSVVAAPPGDPEGDALEYAVVTGGTVPAAAVPPAGLAAVVSATGGALAAATRYYVVTAVDAAGETVTSAQVTGTTVGTTGSVALTWGAVPTATSYRVYRGTVSGGPYSFLADVTATTYTDTGAVAPDPLRTPSGVNTTGGKLRVPVRADQTGPEWNVGAGAITQLVSPLDQTTVINVASVVGGTEVETDDSLRSKLFDRYLGQGAGTAADYRRWAREEPGVGGAVVLALWNGAGTVKVIIFDSSGAPTSAQTVTSLQARLDPVPAKGEGEAPIGATVTVQTATTLAVVIDVPVEFLPGYSVDGFGGTVALGPRIQQLVTYYAEHVPPGDEVVRAQIIGQVAALPGVHDVGDVRINAASINLPVPSNPPRTPDVTAVNVSSVTL
jgi:uncharacterized phage protein gp47/JayE